MSSMESAPAIIPATRAGTSRCALAGSCRALDREVVGGQLGQACLLGQCYRRHQTGGRHQVRVIEIGMDAVRDSHYRVLL